MEESTSVPQPSNKDLDEWIEQLFECKQLTESQVKTVCDKVSSCSYASSHGRKIEKLATFFSPRPGVCNLHRCMFSSSEVAHAGFDQTWNLNLQLIMITIRIKLSSI